MPLLQLVDILCLPLIWPPLFCDSWLTLPLVSVLLIVPGSVTAHGDSHATCRSGHHSHCRLHRKGVKIWHFVFGNGTHLVPTYRAYPFPRSEEHTSELQSLMRNSYAVFCLKKKKTQKPLK